MKILTMIHLFIAFFLPSELMAGAWDETISKSNATTINTILHEDFDIEPESSIEAHEADNSKFRLRFEHAIGKIKRILHKDSNNLKSLDSNLCRKRELDHGTMNGYDQGALSIEIEAEHSFAKFEEDGDQIDLNDSKPADQLAFLLVNLLIGDQIEDLAKNQFWAYFNKKLPTRMVNQIWYQIEFQIENQSNSQIRNNQWHRIWGQVSTVLYWGELRIQIASSIPNIVENQVKSQISQFNFKSALRTNNTDEVAKASVESALNIYKNVVIPDVKLNALLIRVSKALSKKLSNDELTLILETLTMHR